MISKVQIYAVGLILLLIIITYIVPYFLAVAITLLVIASWIKGRKTSYMSYDKYQAYLKSPQWFVKREQVFKRDNFKCRHCHSAVTLETGHCHHKTYRRLGDEQLSDLITLCRKCHDLYHLKDH